MGHIRTVFVVMRHCRLFDKNLHAISSVYVSLPEANLLRPPAPQCDPNSHVRPLGEKAEGSLQFVTVNIDATRSCSADKYLFSISSEVEARSQRHGAPGFDVAAHGSLVLGMVWRGETRSET